MQLQVSDGAMMFQAAFAGRTARAMQGGCPLRTETAAGTPTAAEASWQSPSDSLHS